MASPGRIREDAQEANAETGRKVRHRECRDRLTRPRQGLMVGPLISDRAAQRHQRSLAGVGPWGPSGP